MSTETISCKDVMSHICDNLGEDNGSDRCRQVMEHLRNCEKCRNYFSSIEQTIDYYKTYCEQVTPECHQRLMEYLSLED